MYDVYSYEPNIFPVFFYGMPCTFCFLCVLKNYIGNGCWLLGKLNGCLNTQRMDVSTAASLCYKLNGRGQNNVETVVGLRGMCYLCSCGDEMWWKVVT